MSTIEDKNEFAEFEKTKAARKNLLPWWIKFFCWVFMIFGAFMIFILGLALFNLSMDISIYGLEAKGPLSLYGCLITLVVLYKSYTGYVLWFEKDNAIYIAQIDAIVGILLCTASMFLLPTLEEGNRFTFRLELLFLIPYLIRLNKIKKKWEEGTSN